jgi:hypothetical protein
MSPPSEAAAFFMYDPLARSLLLPHSDPKQSDFHSSPRLDE